MSDKTHIEWTDATWNPVTGCSKVSAGCKHCYAERTWERLSANPQTRYYGRAFTDVQCHADVLELPLRWKKPRRIFVNSMSDLFHEDVPDEFIAHVFCVMAQSPQHTFQVLTKRPERMREWFAKVVKVQSVMGFPLVAQAPESGIYVGQASNWPLPNVWIGVSVEDQATADERIPLLLQAPAAVRWISAEPLLGQVNLNPCWLSSGCGIGDDDDRAISQCFGCRGGQQCAWPSKKLNWVVVGGESGQKARPMWPDWARRLRDQCAAAGVPFLFKQWGEWGPDWEGAMTCTGCGATKFDAAVNTRHRNDDGNDECGRCGGSQWNEATQPREDLARVGKKAAGRQLDGVQHDGYPEVRS